MSTIMIVNISVILSLIYIIVCSSFAAWWDIKYKEKVDSYDYPPGVITAVFFPLVVPVVLLTRLCGKTYNATQVMMNRDDKKIPKAKVNKL